MVENDKLDMKWIWTPSLSTDIILWSLTEKLDDLEQAGVPCTLKKTEIIYVSNIFWLRCTPLKPQEEGIGLHT